MASVREAVYELLRDQGLTTVFGNPGSTELPFLAALPPDFRYVLGLQEASVVAMAEGYARARRAPALVNLHTAPGVGHALGALFNARQDHAPLVVLAGQQARAQITIEANLTLRDPVRLAEPYLKWAFEPPRAADVPHALARAIATAQAPPAGPVLVSVPMDDWLQPADETLAAAARKRRVTTAGAPTREQADRLAAAIAASARPAFVAGPELDHEDGHRVAVTFAERLQCDVYATPAPGGAGVGFPETHPLFRSILPPAIAPLGEALAAHDLVVVAGSQVFPYYPYLPGPPLPAGCRLLQVTCDPEAAARAIAGEALVADPCATLTAILEALERRGYVAPPRTPAAAPPPAGEPPAPEVPEGRLAVGDAARAIRAAAPPHTAMIVEAPSATLALRRHLRIERPRSWFFAAGGGLGFGLPAAVGVKLAEPQRPVVAIVGEGSAQYAIQALWTAAAESLAVVFVILRNDEYAILKWFAQLEGEQGAPGLDLPGLDCVALARAYGVAAERVSAAEELADRLREALAGERPVLLEVPVAAGMAIA